MAPQQPGHPLSGSQKPQFVDLGLEQCIAEVDEVKQHSGPMLGLWFPPTGMHEQHLDDWKHFT